MNSSATTCNSLAWSNLLSSASTIPAINTSYSPQFPLLDPLYHVSLMFNRHTTLICHECNKIFEGRLHKIKCMNCEHEYNASVLVSSVKIAGEKVFVPFLADKCPKCGINNMDRISAEGECPSCGGKVIEYLGVKRELEDDFLWVTGTGTGTGAGTGLTQWGYAPYIPSTTTGTGFSISP